MAANKTNFWKSLIIQVMRGSTIPSPVNTYLALFTADPGVTGDTTFEVSGGGYVRQSFTWDTDAGTPGQTQNQTITFPVATASYGTVTHLGIMDALSAGNMLYFGVWTVSKVINIDDVAQVNVGAMQLDET